jgi:hypothetical protein
MEFRNTLEVLHANAEEIRQLMARLEKRNEISTIELDLILEKLRSIYDLVLDMQSALIVKADPELEIVEKTEASVSLPIEDPEEKTPEQVQQKRKDAAREQVERDLKKPEVQNEEKSSGSSFVSDRFKTSKPSLNEELAAKTKSKEIPTNSKTRPTSAGISSSLGLNEKFEIINELFGGDKNKFDQTMQELNMAGSFVEAYNHLNSTFNWDMDNAYVQRLLEIIRRKLIIKRNEQ